MPVTGFKLTAHDRDNFLRPDQMTITLFLEGEREPIEIVTGKASMWHGTCRELLKKEIGQWLLKAKLAPWPKHHPERRRRAQQLRNIRQCTACSFWDTGLNPTPPWRRVEVASGGAPPG